MSSIEPTFRSSDFLTHPSIPTTIAAAELHAAIVGRLLQLDLAGELPAARALSFVVDRHGPANLKPGAVSAGDAICRECAAPLGPNDYAAGDVNAAYPCLTVSGIAHALGLVLPPPAEWYDDVIELMPAGTVRPRLRLVR